GAVMAMPIGGGAPTTLVANVPTPFGISIDSDDVYFTSGGSVAKVAKTGGPVVTLATGSEPYQVVVDAGKVFWTDVGTWDVTSIAAAGGQATVLVNALGAMHLTVDGSHVYVAEYAGNGSIVEVPRSGGVPAEIVKLENTPSVVTLDATHLYWATEHELHRAALDGSKVETIAVNDSLTRGLVLDDQFIYWATDALAIDQQPGIAKLAKSP
ncbi:MAG: hypothetical protein ACM31C_13855, partial [Acidobacteriota bacterium]